MIAAIKQQLFTNWHTMRWVALAFGLVLGTNWLINSAPISGFLALFFLFQAVTNTGCLAGQCAPAVPATENKQSNIEDVEYEEIKN
jgi:hypothetical protein